jgi:hypothetical protein
MTAMGEGAAAAVTTPCVQAARGHLEESGYETTVFHATRTGGQAMERLIRDGIIDGVFDITTTERAEELVGGVLNAGSERLDATAQTGVPQVVSTGTPDIVNFGPRDSVPYELEGRQFHVHILQVTLMRTTPKECAELGEILTTKLNAATGPAAVALLLSPEPEYSRHCPYVKTELGHSVSVPVRPEDQHALNWQPCPADQRRWVAATRPLDCNHGDSHVDVRGKDRDEQCDRRPGGVRSRPRYQQAEPDCDLGDAG